MSTEVNVRTWRGSNPYYLAILLAAGNHVIDLDEPGWIARESESGLLRAPGTWLLIRKDSHTVALAMTVVDGEQPYYVRRVIGLLTGGTGQITCHGIGKKRLDGHVDRLWILPNGAVCAGDDVGMLGSRILRLGQ